jgi:hypothetical protein
MDENQTKCIDLSDKYKYISEPEFKGNYKFNDFDNVYEPTEYLFSVI